MANFEVMTRSYAPRTGIVAEGLTPQLGQFFGAKNGEGVLVRSVEKGSAAEQAGLRAGDVITKINGDVVNDRGDFRRLMRGKDGSLSVTVLRDKHEQTLSMKLPEQKHRSEFFPENYFPENFEFEVPQVSDSEIKQIKLLAQDQALKQIQQSESQINALAQNEALNHIQQDEIRRQVEAAKRQVERSMKDLEKELHDEWK